MFISKDALWKGIIENLIDDFIVYFFPDLAKIIDFERGAEFLDTELKKLVPDSPGQRRHADKLIKVYFKDGKEIWVLIHVEVQGYQDPYFAQRMFECIYRIRDRFQRQVISLAIYTDWDRTYHYTEFQEEFFGTSLNYKFNTYVLRDHSPEELAKDPNPFAAVMEAAWLHLNRPKDEQNLRLLKLDIIQRLKARNISREKISLIIDFIRYIAPFTNPEINANFEQDLLNLSNTIATMGLREAILEDVKQQGIEKGIEQGIEQGIEKGKLEVTLNLWSTQEFSLEKIAILVDLPLERLQELILAHLKGEGMAEEMATEILRTYQEKFSN
jgi:predicted transposase/invertase (TIGR01784 family)